MTRGQPNLPPISGLDDAWDDHPPDDGDGLVHGDGADGGTGGTDGEEALAGPFYPDVTAWVEEFFSHVFWRDLEGARVTWCPEWWRHAEVVYRLEALWRAWEHLRQDAALGPATWTIQHLDHHLPILLDVDGPMRGCTPHRGHREQSRVLPTRSPYEQ